MASNTRSMWGTPFSYFVLAAACVFGIVGVWTSGAISLKLLATFLLAGGFVIACLFSQ